MNGKDYIPAGYSDLATWLKNMIAVSKLGLSRWQVSAGKLDPVEAASDEFSSANDAAESSSASKVDRQLRKDKATVVKKEVRKFVNANLRYNENVTNEDRLALGLTVPDPHHTPIPPPATYPICKIDTSIIMRVTVLLYDGAKTTHSKPHGVHGCEIRWALFDGVQSVPDGLAESKFTTKSSYTFKFDEADRGKRLCFRARWESTTGEPGPWSEMLNAVVP
ncbi:MAG: hypothetical protein LBC98_08420 [Prevotellaceae bacterium]|jgi:hypothetical protein|nr:hypothetical protein [Prevotellaceae bacterium]